jgi:arsenite methyltransferase
MYRSTVMAEIFQVLKPGGRLFLVEPTVNLKTQLPLSAMRLVTRLIHSAHRETFPKNAKILSSQDFEDLVRSQPWSKVSIQMYGDYQCAVCDKSGDALVDFKDLEIHEHGIAVTGSRSIA